MNKEDINKIIFILTFESIVNIENRTKRSVIELTNDMAQGKYSFKELLVILSLSSKYITFIIFK